jgi:hypothetical protein
MKPLFLFLVVFTFAGAAGAALLRAEPATIHPDRNCEGAEPECPSGQRPVCWCNLRESPPCHWVCR